MFIEMFITAALVFAVLMLAAEKHRLTAFAPIGIGLTLFAGELFALEFTGGSMNTARSFGPAVVTSFANSHWVVRPSLPCSATHIRTCTRTDGVLQYWLGPTLGSVFAAVFYKILKALDYGRLNPGQDDGTAADVFSLPTDSKEKLPILSSTPVPVSTPPPSVLGGINALRLQTRTATINGRHVLVGHLPLGGLDTSKIVPGEVTNLTILFEPQDVQAGTPF
jgi:Major intrinsic protein